MSLEEITDRVIITGKGMVDADLVKLVEDDLINLPAGGWTDVKRAIDPRTLETSKSDVVVMLEEAAIPEVEVPEEIKRIDGLIGDYYQQRAVIEGCIQSNEKLEFRVVHIDRNNFRRIMGEKATFGITDAITNTIYMPVVDEVSPESLYSYARFLFHEGRHRVGLSWLKGKIEGVRIDEGDDGELTKVVEMNQEVESLLGMQIMSPVGKKVNLKKHMLKGFCLNILMIWEIQNSLRAKENMKRSVKI